MMNNSPMNILRQNLAHLIRKHELSANALAQASGASQATVSRILSGDSTDPRAQSLEPIATYFNMSVEQLRSNLIPGAEALELEPERQSRRKTKIVAKLVNPIPGNTWTSSSGPALEARLLSEIIEAAPKDSKQLFNASKHRIPFPEWDYPREWDYASDSLALNIKVIPVHSQLGEQYFGFGYNDHVIDLLWHISTKKLQESLPKRHYVLAIIFVDRETETPINFIQPNPNFRRISSEAEIHGITITQTTPAAINSMIAEIERLAATRKI
jgi:transcriptional regulator with XRE-family HTH domain